MDDLYDGNDDFFAADHDINDGGSTNRTGSLSSSSSSSTTSTGSTTVQGADRGSDIILRTWELENNSTRYERLRAAPSDDTLMAMWSVWVVMSASVAMFVGVVLAGILCKRRTRKNPFNLYLVYLMIPDILFSAGCAFSCLMNVLNGQYWGDETACFFQSFYLIFGFAGNAWLNMLIGQEVHRLLLSSRELRRYKMPTTRAVTVKAVCAYVWAAFMASWGIWGAYATWWPQQAVLMQGMGCLPMVYDTTTSLFYFLVFLPLAVGIPIGYVLYIAFDIWRRELMPSSGKRRMLSIYFMRIVAVFLIMWIPFLILVVTSTGNPLIFFLGGSWGHIQGILSSAMSLTKPDVYQAVREFITCQCATNKKSRRARSRTPERNSRRSQSQRKSSSEENPPSMDLSGAEDIMKEYQTTVPVQTVDESMTSRRSNDSSAHESVFLSKEFMWPRADSNRENTVGTMPAEEEEEDGDEEEVRVGNELRRERMTNSSRLFPVEELFETTSEIESSDGDKPDDFLPRQREDHTYDDETVIRPDKIQPTFPRFTVFG